MSTILDHARDVLTLSGYDVNETRDLPHGWQLRCAGGEVICVYSTGKVVAQGRGAPAVKALFDANPAPKPVVVVKPRTPAPAAAGLVEDANGFVPRYPPGWSWEPWDGLTAPF